MSKRKSKSAEPVSDEKKPKLGSFVAARRQPSRQSVVKAQELIRQHTQLDSDEEAGDSDDDFILTKDDKKKPNGTAILPVDTLLSSASSDDDEEEGDEEEEEDDAEEGEEEEVKPKKGRAPKPKLMQTRKGPLVFPKSAPISKSARCVLSSDSDSDLEDVPAKTKTTKSKKVPAAKQLTDSESDMDDVPAEETDFHQLFPLLTQQDTRSLPQKILDEEEKKKKSMKSAAVDVSQLLAMGETQEPVASTSKAKGTKAKTKSKPKVQKKAAASDESDWEEVKHGREHVIPKEGVEVKIEAPDGQRKKKKSKAMDMEACIKRRINQVRREKQVELHKVSLLCHLSHGMVVSRTLSSPSIMAVALSILPSQHCYPPKQTDIPYLEKITAWFKKKIFLGEAHEDKNLTLVQQLEKSFIEKKACNKRLLVFMFVAMLRSLGVKTRLIISLQPLPLKLGSVDLLTTVTKPAEEESPKKGAKKPVKKEVKNEKSLKEPTKTTKDSKKEVSKSKESKATNSKSKNSKPESSKTKEAKPSPKGKESKPEPRTRRGKKETESKYFSKGNSSSSPDVDQKLKNLRSRNNNKYKEESSEDSEFEESPAKKRRSGSTKTRVNLDSNDDDDFRPEVIKVVKNSKIKVENRKVLSSDSENSNLPKKRKAGNDYWVEVFVEMEEKWICVDVVTGKVHCVEHLHAKASSPVLYVMGFGQDRTVRDLTRRYCHQYHTNTRKQRVDQEWWEEATLPFFGRKTAYDKEEEEQMEKQLQDRPVPKTLSELKNHPLYCLKRHLLKFEGIYPPDAPPLGFFKDEPIFARECVFTLRSREVWVKEAKVVKPKEEPYKIVKSRPKYDRMSGQMRDSMPLEIFGPWQTQDYVPPTAENGKVPRNEYGNVELFKPCMLPKGTVHLKVGNLMKLARKLGIDCASAMVGFDFHGGSSHPVYEGVVVCEEFKDTLLDAHRQDEEERIKRAEDKRLKRIYGNWKRLINGLFIREKLVRKYDFAPGTDKSKSKKTTKKEAEAAPSTSKATPSTSTAAATNKKVKRPLMKVVKRKKVESSSDAESSSDSDFS